MVVAHNGFDFDFPFINYELQQIGQPIIPRDKQLDSIVIARHKVFGPKEYTLDALAKWFGVSLTARANAHGALIDAEILAKVYLEIEQTAPQKTIAELIEQQHAAFLAHPKIGENFPRREFPPSAEELSAHADMMQKVKKD
jgi:DNA polymerase-3 subunit epsilon